MYSVLNLLIAALLASNAVAQDDISIGSVAITPLLTRRPSATRTRTMTATSSSTASQTASNTVAPSDISIGSVAITPLLTRRPSATRTRTTTATSSSTASSTSSRTASKSRTPQRVKHSRMATANASQRRATRYANHSKCYTRVRGH
jgi:hypothetical protein